jgi:hypothetical protein
MDIRNLDSRELQNPLDELVHVTPTSISCKRNTALSSLPSDMFATLELHRINGAGRHLLLRLVCIQLSKRHVLLRHHRNSTLIVQEIRGSAAVFPVQFRLACIALLMPLHQ